MQDLPSQIGNDLNSSLLPPSSSSSYEITSQHTWLPTSIPSRSVCTSSDTITVFFARPLPLLCLCFFRTHSQASLSQMSPSPTLASTLWHSSKRPRVSWDYSVRW